MSESVLENRSKDRKLIDEVTTVLWDADMGRRLALVRMKQLLEQRQMAERFQVSQASYSRIETGRTRVIDRTVAEIKLLLGVAFPYVVFGMNPERYNSRVITDHYWNTRLRVNRKNRSRYSAGGGSKV